MFDKRSSAPWMLSCNPYAPSIVWPGRLVTDREQPQNYFDIAKQLPPDNFPAPEIDVMPINTPSYLESLKRHNKLSVTLSSFASQYLSNGHTRVKSLDACTGTRYLLVQGDDWLEKISALRPTQDWLEKRIQREHKKVWMVTGVLTLSDAKVSTSKSRSYGVGLGGSAPILAAVGLPMPSPLDPSVEVSSSYKSSEERKSVIPHEMVFEILYTRVDLSTRKMRAVELEYSLKTGSFWKPSWGLRTATQRAQEDEDEDEEMEYDLEQEAEQDMLRAAFQNDENSGSENELPLHYLADTTK